MFCIQPYSFSGAEHSLSSHRAWPVLTLLLSHDKNIYHWPYRGQKSDWGVLHIYPSSSLSHLLSLSLPLSHSFRLDMRERDLSWREFVFMKSCGYFFKRSNAPSYVFSVLYMVSKDRGWNRAGKWDRDADILQQKLRTVLLNRRTILLTSKKNKKTLHLFKTCFSNTWKIKRITLLNCFTCF